MYKKIIFILLTLLFMSGSCDLDGDKPNAISKKAQTVSPSNNPKPTDSTPIDTTPTDSKPTDLTPISLVNTESGSTAFYYIEFVMTELKTSYKVHVESVLIKTTDAALRAAGITKLSEAKNMRDKDKLRELIKSLTFTIKTEYVPNPDYTFTITGDYENLKIIYDGLSKNVEDLNLQPKLNINGKDVEFERGYRYNQKINLGSFDNSSGYQMKFTNNQITAMRDLLGDILGINGPEKFKKYLP